MPEEVLHVPIDLESIIQLTCSRRPIIIKTSYHIFGSCGKILYSSLSECSQNLSIACKEMKWLAVFCPHINCLSHILPIITKIKISSIIPADFRLFILVHSCEEFIGLIDGDFFDPYGDPSINPMNLSQFSLFDRILNCIRTNVFQEQHFDQINEFLLNFYHDEPDLIADSIYSINSSISKDSKEQFMKIWKYIIEKQEKNCSKYAFDDDSIFKEKTVDIWKND